MELDSELRAAARRGDQESAAKLLVEAHAPALGRVCMALLGSQGEAQDALRETLEEALEALPTLPAERPLKGWLSSLARRRCARRTAAEEPRSAMRPSKQATPSQRARAHLGELRPTEREALVLRFGGELEVREVAEALGVDEAGARLRLSRGLSRLGELLSEDES